MGHTGRSFHVMWLSGLTLGLVIAWWWGGPERVSAQTISAEQFGEMLDKAVPTLLDQNSEPGLAVALVHDGQLAWVRSYGMANVQNKQPITNDTRFQAGSISKTLTALAILRLVERNQVDLDQPVGNYTNGWQLPESEFRDQVTVRRLLNHTAGISLPSISGVDLGTPLPSLVEELNGQGPSETVVTVTSKPGKAFRYSGGGYTVLQLVVEDVSGRPFADFIEQEVFGPLKMEHSTFGWSDTIRRNVATPYNEGSLEPRTHRLYSSLAAAGLYTTAEDLAKLIIALQSESPPLLDHERIQQMMSPGENSPEYGLGLEIYPPIGKHPVVGHGGSNLGWKANFFVSPTTGDGLAIMTNVDGGKTRMQVVQAFSKYLKQKLTDP